jgi:hypothetical protein
VQLGRKAVSASGRVAPLLMVVLAILLVLPLVASRRASRRPR